MKKLFFAFTLLFFLALAIFPDEIYSRCVAWRFGKACEKMFGGKFDYEELVIESGKVILKKGSLCKQGEFQATFSEAVLGTAFHLKKREISCDLGVDGLKIIHFKEPKKRGCCKKTSCFSLLNFSLTTHIRSAEWMLQKEGKPLQTHHFELKKTIAHHAFNGELSLLLDGSEKPIQAHIHHSKDRILKIRTHLDSQPFGSSWALMNYFFFEELPLGLDKWSVESGVLNGECELSLYRGVPLALSGSLELDRLNAENAALKICCELDHFGADLNIDFASPDTFDGEFVLEGGRLGLKECYEFCKAPDFNNIHTKICVKKGHLESTTLNGVLLGLNSEVVLDWYSPDVIVKMDFQGVSKEMWTLFSEPWQKKFQKAFPNDFFAIQAWVRRCEEGLELEGSLGIVDEQKERYAFDFGCHFGKGKEVDIFIPQSLPVSLTDSVDHFLGRVKHQFCLAQKYLGWFDSKNVPLEKFISPFLFAQTRLELSGNSKFEGTFDEKYLIVFYEGDKISLDGPHFSFEVPQLNKQVAPESVAVHYIDLQSGKHVGFLPLKNALYTQKTHQLEFSNSDAFLTFENNTIHIQDIKTHWNQLDFEGEVELAIHAADDVDLSIWAHSISGPVSDAQKVLSHFTHSYFWDIPLKGAVRSLDTALFFKYHFSPHAVLLDGKIQGDFVGGLDLPLFSLKDLSTHIEFDHVKNQLTLQDIEGNLTLPAFRGNEGPSFFFKSPCVTCVDFPFFQYDFEADVSNLGHIRGHTKNVGGLRSLSLVGDQFDFQALEGEKAFEIVKLKWKDWESSGNISWDASAVEFKKILLSDGDRSNLSFSGAFNRHDQSLAGEIDRFAFPFEKASLASWNPKGEIYGSAKVQWKVSEEFQIHADTSFRELEFGGLHFGQGKNLKCFFSSAFGLSIEGLEFKFPAESGMERYKLGKFHYDDRQNKIHFDGFDFSIPPEKFTLISKVMGTFFPGKVDPKLAHLIKTLKVDEPLEGRISLEIYPNNMWIMLNLADGEYHFLDKKLDLKDFSLIYDPLELNIWTQCRYLDQYYWIHGLTDSMTLSHGKFALSDTRKQSQKKLAPDSALVVTWERAAETGVCIRNVEGTFLESQVKLTSVIPKMELSDEIQLRGQIAFSYEKILPLLPEETKNYLNSLKLAGKFVLDGEFFFPKENLLKPSFSATLAAQDCKLAAVEFSSLSADLDYEAGEIDFSNLVIKDWAGRLSLSQGKLLHEDDVWKIKLYDLHLNEVRLSRLRSPWTKWSRKDKPFFRSLFIPSFELDEFSGTLTELKSFVGSGRLEFSNLPKKTLFNNLLFLPTEITARIGLDLTALVPAKGTIIYEIQDGKICLNEFKDVYSDGKRSRFYLASGAPAFVDFNGNLNISVRMKQYNLLMKLAELFTISVKGTLKHPKYSFSSQDDVGMRDEDK